MIIVFFNDITFLVRYLPKLSDQVIKKRKQKKEKYVLLIYEEMLKKKNSQTLLFL